MRKLWIPVLLVLAVAYLWQGPRSLVSGKPGASDPGSAIAGSPKATDGDSLELDGIRIRLHAIDAPEGRQSCTRSGAQWPCGDAAALKLRSLVAASTIECTQTDTDSYGRTVAICRNGNVDLGAEMVSAGLALAYRQYGDDYVDEENAAKAARRGMWAGEFTAPWDYRHGADAPDGAATQQRQPAEQSPPRGECPIKGNLNRDGERIYHVPGSANYEETIIDESKGERWFCTEEQARAAGWRAPRGR